jgi:hypothetical protein
MKSEILAGLGLALLLAACNAKSDEKAEKAEASWDADAEKDGKRKSVEVTMDSDSGDYGLKLPGGVGGSLKLPPGLMNKADFEINGVKPYPGAKIASVKINATEGEGKKRSNVVIRFDTPDAPATVADWYEQAFKAKGAAVTRNGTTLSGTTRDDDAFTIELAAKGEGTTGTLTLLEDKTTD